MSLVVANSEKEEYAVIGIDQPASNSYWKIGDINNGKEWRGKPAHTMIWKSSIAKKHTYSDKQNGEDVDWVKRAYLDIKTQHRIDKVLYYYDANYNTTSETANLSDDVIMKNIEILTNNT